MRHKLAERSKVIFMSGQSTFNESFDETIFEESIEKLLPAGLVGGYHVLECLNSADGCETLLVSQKETNAKFVAKCYSKTNPLFDITEPEQMAGIENEAIPHFAGEYRNEEYRCVLREYVEGVSLYDYARTHKMTEEKTADIAIKLVHAMKTLHNLEPPVIHRDIKPQNIIIKEDESIALIDFGISRIYKESGSADTVFCGTRFFAPPEQYGFMQTDIRSDIYSFGVVLSWMLTGEAKPVKEPNTKLEKIACKCCEFAPDRRFKNDEALEAELLKAAPGYKNQNGKKLKNIRIGIIALALCIIAGCFAYMFAANAGLMGAKSIKFKEPLIEQAVRTMLDKPSGAVTTEDLESVEGIYILGEMIVTSSGDFYDSKDEWYRQGMVSGGITDLSDLEGMSNLRAVYIGGQDVEDISPLKDMEKLEEVEFFYNRIEDISPLENKQSLWKAGLSFNELISIDAFSTCPRIVVIDLRSAGSFDGKPLESLNGLNLLDIVCDSDAYKYLGGMYVDMLKLGAPDQTDIECIRDAAEIKRLYIDWSEITDISALAGREDIAYLNMSGCIIDDISPIFSMPALEKVEISAKNKDQFDAYVGSEGGDYGFEVVFTE